MGSMRENDPEWIQWQTHVCALASVRCWGRESQSKQRDGWRLRERELAMGGGMSWGSDWLDFFFLLKTWSSLQRHCSREIERERESERRKSRDTHRNRGRNMHLWVRECVCGLCMSVCSQTEREREREGKTGKDKWSHWKILQGNSIWVRIPSKKRTDRVCEADAEIQESSYTTDWVNEWVSEWPRPTLDQKSPSWTRRRIERCLVTHLTSRPPSFPSSTLPSIPSRRQSGKSFLFVLSHATGASAVMGSAQRDEIAWDISRITGTLCPHVRKTSRSHELTTPLVKIQQNSPLNTHYRQLNTGKDA